jgi:hypothetical protein
LDQLSTLNDNIFGVTANLRNQEIKRKIFLCFWGEINVEIHNDTIIGSRCKNICLD